VAGQGPAFAHRLSVELQTYNSFLCSLDLGLLYMLLHMLDECLKIHFLTIICDPSAQSQSF